MRVLHVTNAYPYEDYSSYGIFIKEQIESLGRIGLSNNIVFINARKFGFVQYLFKIREVLLMVSSFKPNVIHCHHEFSIIPCLPALLFYRTHLVLSLLGDLSQRSWINRFFVAIISSLPRVVLYKSTNVPRIDNAHYLPNGVDMDLFKPFSRNEAIINLGLDLDKKYVLFVSASLNNPIKRYDLFTRVVNELKKYDSQVEELVMSGVERDLVPSYYMASSFMLLTSDHEGSPNAVKEAMCCNTPIVSTDVGNVSSLFVNSKGLFVESKGDFAALVKSSKLALAIPESNGREVIRRLNLGMEEVSRQLGAIYIKITD